MKKQYTYCHTVLFEETNLVGNVYYVNHLKWQGHCRELFIKENAPDLLKMIESEGLALVTLDCSCQYFSELRAFENVLIRMTLMEIVQNKITMRFDYYKENEEDQLIAQGFQTIACMKRQDSSVIPVQIPASLRKALMLYE